MLAPGGRLLARPRRFGDGLVAIDPRGPQTAARHPARPRAAAPAPGARHRIGQDDDRRLQPLGAMDRHHPHLAGALLVEIALDLDLARGEPGEE